MAKNRGDDTSGIGPKHARGLPTLSRRAPATLLALAVGWVLFVSPVHADEPNDLWRQGFSVIQEYGYVEVEECDPDTSIRLDGSGYFECSGYEYPYHYGGAMLVGKLITYRGRQIPLTYLCLEDSECLPGTFSSTAMFKGYRCTVDCSGHEAGYQWAEDRGIYDPDDCGGNSQSFIEGCIAYAEGQ